MTETQPCKQDADRLYNQHVKQLEPKHKGEYIAVSLDGKTILAPTLLQALEKAEDIFGRRQTVVFEVGIKAVGKL